MYYQNDPGAEDDGVTLGVHIDQLPDIPEWLPEWGVVRAAAKDFVDLFGRARKHCPQPNHLHYYHRPYTCLLYTSRICSG